MSNPFPFTAPSLFIRESARRYRLASEAEVMDAARVIVEQHLVRGPAMTDPSAVKRYLSTTMALLPHEVFRVLFLDNQHQLLVAEDVARGTIDAASVYPREIVKLALKYNAATLIFAHNHPSGIPNPSTADRLLTDRLKQALALVDVRVIDHLVVGGTQVSSFAELGWI